ncbi:ankyrin repeat-containing domain protein [Xylariomycetidae sp. FL2044]|nr:ankyrin repeat-containing domain protein [Xylariomycetidae sp. FL2044]
MASPLYDEAQERRRNQNRVAQRRFRQRHCRNQFVSLDFNTPEITSTTILKPNSLTAQYPAQNATAMGQASGIGTRNEGSFNLLLNETLAACPDLDGFPFCTESLDPAKTVSKERRPGGWIGPLHLAALNDETAIPTSFNIIRMLISHGADPNELDERGLSPLSHAVMAGHLETARLLLSHGAKIEPEMDGRSPLHLAALHRREALLHLLLEHCPLRSPALINECHDRSGMNPLHVAIQEGFEEGVRLLLLHGADPCSKIKSIDGPTASQEACEGVMINNGYEQYPL